MVKINENLPDEPELGRLKEKIASLEAEINQYKSEQAGGQKDENPSYSDLLLRLEEAEARYFGLFEGVPDSILVADAQGNYIDANVTATKMLGYSHAQFLQMNVADIMSLDPDQTQKMFSEFTQKGYWRGEVDLRHKDGKLVPAESNARVINLLSGTIYVAVIRDITQRKELEKQKDEFLMTASHDLRSPLTSVLGLAQLLETKLRQQLAKEITNEQDLASLREFIKGLMLYTTPIVHQSQRMNELINRLLEFTRIQSNLLDLIYVARANLVALLQQAIDQHSSTTQTHSLQLQTEESEIWLSYDEARIEEVLDNLITNAIKYSPKKSVIVVGIKREVEKNQVVVWVKDRGYGIGEEDQQRLFERFYRVRTEKTIRVKGLGLGLYISNKIVKAHGGQIWFESKPGYGSTFYFTLPLVKPDNYKYL